MTRRGKCDLCRRRRVKCDERKPACSGCQRKRQPCSYASAQVSNMMHSLPGNQWTDAQQHVGGTRLLGAQTVEQVRPATLTDEESNETPPSPEWPLIGARTGLAMRWTHLFNHQPPGLSSFDALGPIYRTLPSKLDESHLVNLAATYAMDSYSAFKSWSFPDPNGEITLARKSGQKAMKAARDAIHNVLVKSSGVVEIDLLIANRLLFLAELFRGPGSLNFRFHLTAVAQMLQNRWNVGMLGEFEESLIVSTYFEEVVEAVYSGRISTFDDPIRRQAMASSTKYRASESERASRLVMEHLIPMPRLLKLLRICRSQPNDLDLASRVLNLTKELYDSAFGQIVEQYLDKSVTTISTQAEFEANLVQYSYQFKSLDTFLLTVFYYTYQMLISGIILHLLDMGIASPTDFDRASVIVTDLRAAISVAMCTQYAFTHNFDPPLPALRLCQSNRIAFATWRRLERREYTGSAAWTRAVGMENYSLRLVNIISAIWRAGCFTHDWMDMMSCSFVAGDIVSDELRKRRNNEGV